MTRGEASLWDDPELVPVPVLPAFSDNSMTYEVQENAGGKDSVHRVMPPSAHGNQPYYNNQQHSITHTDKTIAGLQ